MIWLYTVNPFLSYNEKEIKLTLQRKPPFLMSYHGNTNPLSLGHLPTHCHLPAGSKSGPAASVPSHWAHFIDKGPSAANWLHCMDTCPLSIGPEIGDFHKGQPTAGRQESPGHCHHGLNWNLPWETKALSVTTAPLPPGCLSAALGPVLWEGRVAEGDFPSPFHFFLL